MDINRYFAEMHKAMAAHKSGAKLLLSVKYQDAAGADAYIELWHSPAEKTAQVCYSTIGRRQLNFELFRAGWQQCHNAAGEMTGQFPASAEELIHDTDFRSFCREDTLDANKTEIILRQLMRCAGEYAEGPAAQNSREASRITVDSFVGVGAHWAYSGAPAEACLEAAAIVYWLADFLAGSERRALQNSLCAAQLASNWQSEMEFAKSIPLSRPAFNPGRTRSQAYAARSRVPGKNERWQSFLAVMAAV